MRLLDGGEGKQELAASGPQAALEFGLGLAGRKAAA